MRNPTWESCCKQGSIQLQLLPDPPEYLKDLLERRHFKDNLRQYNAAFAFTSLGCDIVSAEERNANNNNNNRRGGLNAFQIHGALCHRQGPLIPYDGSEPSYAQLYIYDPSYAAQRRSERNENLHSKIITELSTMLSHCNPFSRIYRHAYEILSRNEDRSMDGDLSNNANGHNESNNSPYIIISPSMRMRLIEGSDRRTRNLPTTEEVAAVIPIEYSDRSFRDIILTLRRRDRNDNIRQGYDFDQHFQRISQTHAAYMPTHYALLFSHGTYGWHWGMRLFSSSSSSSTATITTTAMNEEATTSTRQRDRLSQRAYYRFRLHLRGEHEFPAIFYAKKLFQQFLVDPWAICDQNKLGWIRLNQDRLRADVYNGLADAIAEGDQVNAANLGRRFFLPSSHAIYVLELDHKIRQKTAQEGELPFILTSNIID
ncbi:hypothetical protein RMCBS344292_01556 [Rhizopus microsporus]|nr:hypothetical protein RMCBS344292_01556 [Rhizopus microsporus]